MKLKLKYWFLIGAFIFLWIGAALYTEQIERPVYAIAAWITSGGCLFVAFIMAVTEYNDS